MAHLNRIVACTLMTLLAAAACSSADTHEPSGSNGRRAPDLPGMAGGKADSYVNSAAQEYEFTGSAHMATPAGLDTLAPADAEVALKKAADSRLGQVATAIHGYLRDKAKAANSEIPNELPAEIAAAIADKDEQTKHHILENWKTQQEVSAATRSSKKHLETIRQDVDGSYLFDFDVEGLLSQKLASKIFAESKTFDVTVSSYQAPTSETVSVIAAKTPSTDGYPRYDELFADGVFDVAVHVGGDYNKEEVQICCTDSGQDSCQKYECANSCEPVDDECSRPAPSGCTKQKLGGRVDRWTAEELVNTLKTQGFAHEAQTYQDLKIDSPPFTKTVDFAGKSLEVRVKIVFPEIVACGKESELVESMKESLATKELIIYAGHAGPGAGYVLDYQPRTELDDSVWATLPMPSHYQVLAMYGCETYSTYADAMFASPAKNDANLDVVTTVATMWTNMGLPGTTTLMFGMLMQEQETKRHLPVSWLNLLSWLNLQEQNAHTHYGVHGVDSSPKMSPWVKTTDLCASCEKDADCAGGGNFCLGFPDGTRGCGAVCTDSAGCGDKSSCIAIPGLENSVIPKMCVPNSVTCQ
ncbi:MAG: hypothetical protein IPI67_05305 [Myxococcales bacterium]|nr:hypothetical protein [Myxococcales bacterium]